MKKIIGFVFFFSLLVLVWCGKNTQEIVQDVPVVLSWAESGVCVKEQLLPISPLVMDDLVKNCTEEEKEWLFIDGLWWVFPEYVIVNDQVVSNVWGSTITSGVVCEETDSNWYQVKYTLPTQEIAFGMLPWHEAMKRVIGKWLIDKIAGKEYPDNMYCKNLDCADMLDHGWWTDGKNYFVAWFRSDLVSPEDRHMLYVINNKLYYPGKSKFSLWIIETSKWNFVDIQNNKIIVRRIKNSKVIWNPDTMPPEQLKSTFTLETCEIDL